MNTSSSLSFMPDWGRGGGSAGHQDRCDTPELTQPVGLVKRVMYLVAVGNSWFFSCFHINNQFSKCRQISTVTVQSVD